MFFKIANLSVGLSVMALSISIIYNFMNSREQKVNKEKKSIVETGSMSAFAVAMYFILMFGIGRYRIENPLLNISIAVGMFFVIAGCAANIVGRLNLGKNWGNHIRIYDDHSFSRKGMYQVVRHPLYSSIILMFFGAGLIYSNYLCFIATTVIFIPAMYYRAKQEENILREKFSEYRQYQKEVGMLFPKVRLWK